MEKGRKNMPGKCTSAIAPYPITHLQSLVFGDELHKKESYLFSSKFFIFGMLVAQNRHESMMSILYICYHAYFIR